MLILERLRLVPRLKVVILESEALPLEQILRLEPEGAKMVGHDHPIEGRGLAALVQSHGASFQGIRLPDRHSVPHA